MLCYYYVPNIVSKYLILHAWLTVARSQTWVIEFGNLGALNTTP